MNINVNTSPKTDSNSTLGSDVYSGVATFGKIRAVIGAIVGTIVGIAMFIFGVMLVLHKTNLTQTTQGVITNDPLCQVSKTNNLLWSCSNIMVTFTVDGKTYNITTSADSEAKYVKGENVTVYYQAGKPSNASLSSDNTHFLGWFLVVMSLFILFFSWLWFYASMKYKAVAAVGGVEGIADIFRY